MLKPSPNVHTSGDAYLKEDLLQRSHSLIRRFPSPDTVDLTFPTTDAEERMRHFTNEMFAVRA